jgi:hypothetical protein
MIPRFPNPVYAGIRVTHWANLDVTVCLKRFSKQHRDHNNNTLRDENDWDACESYAAGGEYRLLMFSFLPSLLLST